MKTPPEFRESRDAYSRVIAGDNKHRVFICRDGIQCIIQRAVGRDTSVTGRAWRSFSYQPPPRTGFINSPRGRNLWWSNR